MPCFLTWMLGGILDAPCGGEERFTVCSSAPLLLSTSDSIRAILIWPCSNFSICKPEANGRFFETDLINSEHLKAASLAILSIRRLASPHDDAQQPFNTVSDNGISCIFIFFFFPFHFFLSDFVSQRLRRLTKFSGSISHNCLGES